MLAVAQKICLMVLGCAVRYLFSFQMEENESVSHFATNKNVCFSVNSQGSETAKNMKPLDMK
jgi:hypothetical protein